MLTLNDSVVPVLKQSKTANSITEIEQWRTAFAAYMSIFTQKFPRRSQELLGYIKVRVGLSMITNFARKTAITEPVFRTQITNFSDDDRFIVASSVLKKKHPFSSKGPQPNSISTGGEQRGICHDFNRIGQCKREPCNYRHVCNRCNRPHLRYDCLTIHREPGDLGDEDKGTPKSGTTRRKKWVSLCPPYPH